jgi:hypothetical protein
VIAGKIIQVTEDEQIEIMKTNLQTSGQFTGLSRKPNDFYKQIDATDLLKYQQERYSEHTATTRLKFLLSSYITYQFMMIVFFFLPPSKQI